MENKLYVSGLKLKGEIPKGNYLYNLPVIKNIKKNSPTTFCFSVTDTGKGIKDEEMDFVWNRYYRSSEMHKRPVKGTGLGLSIVKRVLEKHNFRFGIRSKVGAGSTFYVVFPLVEVVNDDEDLGE